MVAEPALIARGLRKRFRGAQALDGVDFDVARGSIVALTGQNGAGKTTTLRIFATLLRPDTGSAHLLGFDTDREAGDVRRLIGVALVNERSLYWRLSGLENLMFFGRTSGIAKRELHERCTRALDEVGLAHMAAIPAAGYSAGQRQRLILARATIADPAVLLIDEPMRGLDDEGIARVRNLFVQHRARKATIVIAGATIGEFADLCDSVIELEHGRVTGTRRYATEPV